MPLEKENYWDTLEMLRERFGGRQGISIKESEELLGCHRETLLKDKTFPAKKVAGRYVVMVPALARWMS